MQSVRSFFLGLMRRLRPTALDDDACDDGLLRHLVGSICLPPVPIVLAAIGGGGIGLAVFFMYGDLLFLGYAVAQIALALYRIRVSRDCRTRIEAARSRAETLAVERSLAPSSIALAVLTGEHAPMPLYCVRSVVFA